MTLARCRDAEKFSHGLPRTTGPSPNTVKPEARETDPVGYCTLSSELTKICVGSDGAAAQKEISSIVSEVCDQVSARRQDISITPTYISWYLPQSPELQIQTTLHNEVCTLPQRFKVPPSNSTTVDNAQGSKLLSLPAPQAVDSLHWLHAFIYASLRESPPRHARVATSFHSEPGRHDRRSRRCPSRCARIKMPFGRLLFSVRHRLFNFPYRLHLE